MYNAAVAAASAQHQAISPQDPSAFLIPHAVALEFVHYAQNMVDLYGPPIEEDLAAGALVTPAPPLLCCCCRHHPASRRAHHSAACQRPTSPALRPARCTNIQPECRGPQPSDTPCQLYAALRPTYHACCRRCFRQARPCAGRRQAFWLARGISPRRSATRPSAGAQAQPARSQRGQWFTRNVSNRRLAHDC